MVKFVVIPHIRSRTSKKVGLVVDNAGSHFDLQDVPEHVTVITLPSKVTSVHQPMEMGVIYNVETNLPTAYGSRVVRDVESRAERRALNQGRTGVMNGLAEGYDPHMLDVANLAKLS